MNARELAEEMYERRRRYDGLRTPWGGLRAQHRRAYEIMAEAAIDSVTMALMQKAIAKGRGGLQLRRDLEAIKPTADPQARDRETVGATRG